MEIYSVRQNSDMTEGRGVMLRKATFLKKEDALAYYKEHCKDPYTGKVAVDPFNDRYGFYDIETIFVHETYSEDSFKEEKRQKILAKLTAEERKILRL